MQQSQKTPKTSAVIYCRVGASDRQVSSDSLWHQETECRRYCASHHWNVRGVFRDKDASAKTAERPELKQMLTFCDRYGDEIGAVVFYSLDRLTRSVENCRDIEGVLKKRRIKLLSATAAVDETPTGRLMDTMLAALAQLHNVQELMKP